MNAIRMRTKNEHISAWCEPLATSTPCKKKPGHLEVKLAPKLPVTQTDSVNIRGKSQNPQNTSRNLRNKSSRTKLSVSTRTKKKRSTYFDLSSSSDDDSSEARGLIIKLSSKKSNKLLTENQKPDNKDTRDENKKTNKQLEKCDEGKNISVNSAKDKESRRESLRLKNCLSQNKNVNSESNNNSCIENNNKESNEENKDLKKGKKRKNIEKDVTGQSKCKVNLFNGDCSNSFNENEKTLKKKSDQNQTMELKTSKKESLQNVKSSKSEPLKKTQNKKLINVQEKKKNKVTSGFIKKKTRKSCNKSIKIANRELVNSINSLTQTKSNMSHQLFSENTEQEYINTLDFTADEVDVNKEVSKCSLESGKKHQSFIWPYQSSLKIGNGNKAKKINSQIVKLMLETQSPKSCPGVSEPGKAENQVNSSGDKISNDVNQEVANAKVNSTQENLKDNNETQSQMKINDKNQELKSSCENNNPSVENNESKKDNKNQKNKNENVKTSEKSVFQQLDELSLMDSESESSAVQCWNVNNFKCGIFKLKMKAQLNWKTRHSDSHWGGVLLKGNLNMKIGVKERNMKEGDMAFVPPLTEWQATNNGEGESIFYFWCGRFKS